jgi:hypothetical protein
MASWFLRGAAVPSRRRPYIRVVDFDVAALVRCIKQHDVGCRRL